MLLKRHIVESPSLSSLRNGFTLAELLLVLAILLVVSGLTFPSIARQWQRSELHAAAVAVRNHLNVARRIAVESGIGQVMVLESDGRGLRILSANQSPNSDEASAMSTRLPDGIRIACKSESSTTLAENSKSCSTIQFAANGTASGQTLLISDENGNAVRLSINRATGVAQIESFVQ